MADPKKDAAHLALTLIQRFVGTQPEALPQMREQVSRELEFSESTAKRLRQELDALDELIGLIADDDTEAAEDPGQLPGFIPIRQHKRVPLRKAVLQVLASRPGRWGRDELLTELTRLGWAPGGNTPRNTLISRLSEMAKEGQVVRIGDGFGLPEKNEVPAM